MKYKSNYGIHGLRHRWDDNTEMDFKETGCEFKAQSSRVMFNGVV
jgi:tRNA G37 N-methylase Trm5